MAISSTLYTQFLCPHITKVQEIQSKCQTISLFALLESTHVKGLHKMLAKSTLGVFLAWKIETGKRCVSCWMIWVDFILVSWNIWKYFFPSWAFAVNGLSDPTNEVSNSKKEGGPTVDRLKFNYPMSGLQHFFRRKLALILLLWQWTALKWSFIPWTRQQQWQQQQHQQQHKQRQHYQQQQTKQQQR